MVGDQEHPLNRALFDKQNPNNKAASEEMKHIQALGYPDKLGTERVAAARDFFGDRHPDRILAGMDYYRNALKPLKPLLDGIVAGGLAAREQAGQVQLTSLAGPARAQTRATPEYFADRVFAGQGKNNGLYAGPPALDGENAPQDKSKTLPRLRAPSPLAQQPTPPRQQPQAAPARDTDIIAGAEGNDRLLGADSIDGVTSNRGTSEAQVRYQDYQARVAKRRDALTRLRAQVDLWHRIPEISYDARSKNQAVSVSRLDSESDLIRTNAELAEAYDHLYFQGDINDAAKESTLYIFFKEGGFAFSADRGAWAGIRNPAIEEVARISPDRNLPKNFAELKGLAESKDPKVKARAREAAIRIGVSYANILTNAIGGINELDRVSNPIARTAYLDTLWEHGPGDGALTLKKAVDETYEQLSSTPEGQELLARANRVVNPNHVGKRQTYDRYVILANSSYRDVLLKNLAMERDNTSKEAEKKRGIEHKADSKPAPWKQHLLFADGRQPTYDYRGRGE